MNESAQKIFDKLVKISPKDLTKDEIAFLHARRSYLTDDQMRIYGDVIAKYHEWAIHKDDVKQAEAPLYVSKKDRMKK